MSQTTGENKNPTLKYNNIHITLTFTDTEDPDWPDVERCGKGAWQRRMGESWESEYCSEDRLEREYQRMVAAGECPDMDSMVPVPL